MNTALSDIVDVMRVVYCHRPGEIVPAGRYRCDGGSGDCPHNAVIRSQRLPQLPKGCRGHLWVLEAAEPQT
jgi:hypothetical protein